VDPGDKIVMFIVLVGMVAMTVVAYLITRNHDGR